jgi:hypothetical protein
VSNPATLRPGLAPKPASATPAPTGLRIPSIGLDSKKLSNEPFEPLGLASDGTMQVPDVKSPARYGWYCPNGLPKCGQPSPGQPGGSVIVSHVNGGGHRGGFYSLAKVSGTGDVHFNVKVGDEIDVDLADNITQVFKVTETLAPKKTAFPASTVWGDFPTPRLTLVTCGGTLDAAHHNYLNQIMVVSDLVGSSNTN